MRTVPADARLLVVGVDQPWIRPTTLDALARMADELPVVPVPDGIRQVTCALYPASLLEVAEAELTGGGSIQSVLDRSSFAPFTDADAEAVGEDGRSWFSVDDEAALAAGLARFGVPGS